MTLPLTWVNLATESHMSPSSCKAVMASFLRARGSKLFFDRNRAKSMQRGDLLALVHVGAAGSHQACVFWDGTISMLVCRRPWCAYRHWRCWAVQSGKQFQMIRYSPEGTRYDPSVGLLWSFERPSLSDSLPFPTALRGPPGPEKRKTEARDERKHSPFLAYAVVKHVLGLWSQPSGAQVHCCRQHLMTFVCLVLIITKTFQKETRLNICSESLYASLRKGFVRHCSLGWLILLCNCSCVSH